MMADGVENPQNEIKVRIWSWWIGFCFVIFLLGGSILNHNSGKCGSTVMMILLFSKFNFIFAVGAGKD